MEGRLRTPERASSLVNAVPHVHAAGRIISMRVAAPVRLSLQLMR
ncbi:hypothetical protein [Actinomadura sp. 3N508]